MTNERAVEILNLDLDILGQYGGESAEAYKMAIKALEQQSSEDAVSREAVIRLVEQYPNIIGNRCSGLISDIKHLPSVTPRINLAETSQDCISREEVQDLISRWLSDYLLDETREALETINYKVGDMPPVTPQRPKGKWMECGGDEPWLKGYCCSLCNFTTTQKYDYCTCGAEMEVQDETN